MNNKHAIKERALALVPVWQQLSDLVLTARHTQRASDANETLRKHLEDDPDGPLSPALLLWIGDNFLHDTRFEEAIEVYSELVNRYPDKTFVNNRPWAVDALEQMASSYRRLGNPKGAINAYYQILKFDSKVIAQSWIYYCIGRIAEENRQIDEARKAYNKAAKSNNENSELHGDVPDMARRAALRLKNQGKGFSDRKQLSFKLAAALAKKDVKALTELASPTHFKIGFVGSELNFIDWRKILRYIKNDLQDSDTRFDPDAMDTSGRKTYLLTEGWKGELLNDRVVLLLTEGRNGWQWSGILLTQPCKAWETLYPPQKPETNQPLTIDIKAPWQAGDCFRAGGLKRYFQSFAPFVGWFIFASDVGSPCGYGPGGFYYNTSGHSGRHAFAIDFVRYLRGVPYVNFASHQPLLCVYTGVVINSFGGTTTGDDSANNFIEIDHFDPSQFGEVLVALIKGTALPRAKYLSRSLHMAGPATFASNGMVVRQGARLGLMDDTGFSAMPHLHFSIHDKDRGGMSVRPTPMDGQSLNDGDDGKCICSSNIPFP